MQKVEGSSPFSRFDAGPANGPNLTSAEVPRCGFAAAIEGAARTEDHTSVPSWRWSQRTPRREASCFMLSRRTVGSLRPSSCRGPSLWGPWCAL